MKNSFKLSELSENTLVGRDIGMKTRHKIKDLLKDYSNLTIDMEDKSDISLSFLDEAIVSLVLEYGKARFSNQIKLKNVHCNIRHMMNFILNDKQKRLAV
ncbi:MAG: STAS-like domain-containing protein [Candidatus Electrothrix sp. YB6]